MTTLAESQGIDLPQLSDALVRLVNLVFGPGAVASFLIAVIAAGTCYQWGRGTYRATRRTGRTVLAAARFSIRHVRQVPVPRRILASCASLAVLCLQAAWLYTTHVFACVLAANFSDDAGGGFDEIVRWEGWSPYYTLTCAALALLAYVLALRSDGGAVPLLGLLAALVPVLCAAPVVLIAVFATVVAALVQLFGSGHSWSDAGYFWLVGLVLLAYAATGYAALTATRRTAAAWRRPGP
ncbi:hypothetical protein [Kitasatospora sp. NPDC092286]|uniref:hypothetical protein n=1 Tax=Kitasatospora sp. NPDC092286 TaxID=3364087 RepID=UPI0037F911F4